MAALLAAAMSAAFQPRDAARRLLQAWEGGAPVPQAAVLPPDREAAFAVQDATVAGLGPHGGWKVGAKGADAEPTCAPLPARGIVACSHRVVEPPRALRGIELEVAIRLGQDVGPDADAAQLALAIDAVFPALEVVETRLAEGRASAPLAQLADLQSHGALVLGAPVTPRAAGLDLRTVRAELAFGGRAVAATQGGNPAGDLWRLLAWLAAHCARRGQPLRAGQVITTGSCTGLLFAPARAHVQGRIAGLGPVDLQF